MSAEPSCQIDVRPGNDSEALQIAKIPGAALALNSSLSLAEKVRHAYNWDHWARFNQILPILQAWAVWLICAGRGWGKSRSGAEAVRYAVEKLGCRRIALVARTASDARDVMVDGESGLLAICPPHNRPRYEKTKRRLTWPNGAIATLYSAENPDLLRGPQHDFAWCDELAAWRYLEETWDNLVMGLRLTSGPCRIVVTTTPRPIQFLRELMKRPDTLLTNGSTYDNLANLNEVIRSNLLRYKGTEKEKQELFGLLRGNIPGALLNQDKIDENRISRESILGKIWKRVAMGLDPSTTQSKDADDYGIVVAAIGTDDHTYVLGDHTVDSKKHGPEHAAQEIVRWCLYYKVQEIFVETNAGGDLTWILIRNTFKRTLPKGFKVPKITPLRSTEGKTERAEGPQALTNSNYVHHVGHFPDLEQELISYIPGKSKKSPGRLDAWTHVVNGLNPVARTSAPKISGANSAADYGAAIGRSTTSKSSTLARLLGGK